MRSINHCRPCLPRVRQRPRLLLSIYGLILFQSLHIFALPLVFYLPFSPVSFLTTTTDSYTHARTHARTYNTLYVKHFLLP